MLIGQCLIITYFLRLSVALGQRQIVTFENDPSSLLLGSSNSPAQIIVDASEWPGVTRAANDLAADFGRVTGINGTITTWSNSTLPKSSQTAPIIVGTLGQSDLIDTWASTNVINVSAIEGQWEAFQSQVVQNPMPGIGNALVIIGRYLGYSS